MGQLNQPKSKTDMPSVVDQQARHEQQENFALTLTNSFYEQGDQQSVPTFLNSNTKFTCNAIGEIAL
jgi:hypothetical protein